MLRECHTEKAKGGTREKSFHYFFYESLFEGRLAYRTKAEMGVHWLPCAHVWDVFFLGCALLQWQRVSRVRRGYPLVHDGGDAIDSVR